MKTPERLPLGHPIGEADAVAALTRWGLARRAANNPPNGASEEKMLALDGAERYAEKLVLIMVDALAEKAAAVSTSNVEQNLDATEEVRPKGQWFGMVMEGGVWKPAQIVSVACKTCRGTGFDGLDDYDFSQLRCLDCRGTGLATSGAGTESAPKVERKGDF